MHPAARLQFERMIGEYARWRAVPEKERSPAPAWWWGPAMELRNMRSPYRRNGAPSSAFPITRRMPRRRKSSSGLSRDRRRCPGHTTFPARPRVPDAKDVRELHPQPSDDSAFQP